MKKFINKVSFTLFYSVKIIPKGFTLIELIVVIAVIGVLAAIILLAINPTEQLARGRDANRISAIEGLGKAMSNYVTANGSTIPVINGTTNAGTWQNTLTASKDITNTITVPNPSGGTLCAGATALSDIQNNVCYAVDAASPAKFTIWTIVESNNERLKAKGGTAPACAAGQGIAYFDSSKGQVQVACMGGTGAGTNPFTGTISQGPFTP